MSNDSVSVNPLLVIGAIGRYLDTGHDFVTSRNVQDEFEQQYQWRPEPATWIEPVLSTLVTFGFLVEIEYNGSKSYSRPMTRVITVNESGKPVEGANQPNIPLWQTTDWFAQVS